MKYRVNVGSFSTRYIERNITVNATSEEEAEMKAKEKYCSLEMAAGSVDSGEPVVNTLDLKGV